ncbi:MAG TPA: COX15/CtaA family protein [Edaphobacter sp.]|jgi:cytochrome c oxidase assembly protein subunit 15|nr:COX15/CtaA family protein [Edaphobacter sp.]
MATTARLTARDTSQLLARFAWFALAFMVLVVLEGAVVRATSSGGGCGNRWPLCNGDFFPHHPRLATVIEYTHRSLTGICTTLVITLTGWTFYATRPGHKARRAVVASCFFLVTEALLGAVLVLRGYVENNISGGRVVMQSIHFTNTMLLLGALSLTVWFLTPRRSESTVSPHNANGLVWLTVVTTILMGATGSLAALADTLFPSPSLLAGLTQDFATSAPLLVRMRWVHPAAAVIGFICVMQLALKVRSRLSSTVFWLLASQIVLGVADVLLLAPVWMQVLHLLGADLFWIALVMLTANVAWPSASTSSRPA